jgi:hypothetical protein
MTIDIETLRAVRAVYLMALRNGLSAHRALAHAERKARALNATPTPYLDILVTTLETP